MNDQADFKDATPRLPVLLSQWYQDLDAKDKIRIKELPEFMQELATVSAQVAYFSPDEKRLLYSSRRDLNIPEGLVADLPAESTQPEDRDVKVGSLYVYDIEEDRNYVIANTKKPMAENLKSETYWSRRLADDRVKWEEATESGGQKKPISLPPVPEELLADILEDLPSRYSPIWELGIQWFPTSAHLLAAGESGISITEYDGTNNSVVYSGPAEENFVYPWPNGSRLAILTNFNDQNSPTNLYAINLK